MKKRIGITLLIMSAFALLLSGCGSGENGDQPQPGTQSQQKTGAVVGAKALSAHYVEVSFDGGVDQSKLDKLRFIITAATGDELAIQKSTLSDNGTTLLLQTDTQQPVKYTLTATTSSPANKALRKVSTRAAATDTVVTLDFNGSSIVEPYINSVIALNNKALLVTFSTVMDKASVENISYYRIVAANDGTPAADVGDVIITSAVLEDTKAANRVRLTTSEQSDIEYLMTVTNVISAPGAKLINPLLSTASFFGIAKVDVTPPKVLNAASTGITTLTLYFSEPLNDSAESQLNYTICATEFDASGKCPAGSELNVLSAALKEHNTMVVLTTEPQQAGVDYYVRVADVKDQAVPAPGNLMPTTITKFTTAAAVADSSQKPHVVGVISTSNTSVIVSFSTAMGSSALSTAHYLFTQENINPEVGTIAVNNVKWFDNTRTAVEIETSPQNEVTYRVTVVNVRDYFGNPMDSKRESLSGVLYDPISKTFAGTPPTVEQLTLGAGNWSWNDVNDNQVVDAGDQVTVGGKSIVLTNASLSTVGGKAVVDNWIDTDSNRVLSAGDIVAGLIDTDGDGLSDNEELRGMRIPIAMSTGQVIIREVTSNPYKVDSDGDGMLDIEEWAYAMDPRSADTDSDGLSDFTEWNVVYSGPADQDSDDDGLADGLEHSFYHTSPILADTDGDQFSDAEELLELNRDPRVADLPNLKIHVGEVKLQLDERYTYVNANGETVSKATSTNTNLSTTNNTSFANSNITVDQLVHSVSGQLQVGLRDAQTDDSAVNGNELLDWKAWVGSIVGRIALEGGFQISDEHTSGTTVQIDRASAKESQQALEKSLSRGSELSKSSEVTRELVGAKISVAVSVENAGNVAMNVSNLELSVLQIDPQNPNKLQPLATLVAASGLLTGNSLAIKLGPFSKSKGPYIFTAPDVYPSLVETLMRNPKSLVFKVVNYDISDEYERSFAFASQIARDRTAGVIFDFGELGSDEHYVATAGTLDSDQVSGGLYAGGFDLNGKPKGLPLGYMLQNVLGINKHDSRADFIEAGDDGVLTSFVAGDDVSDNGEIHVGPNGVLDTIPASGDRLRNPAIQTGIIAGVNKRVDSIAQGDDVQLVPFGTTGVAPKTLVIGPGENGVLETAVNQSDAQEFISGYELRKTCSVSSADKLKVGQFCVSNQNGCACDGPDRLFRVKTFRHGDYNNTWFTFFKGEIPAAADFDEIVVKPGQDIYLAFLQDLDKDGLFAREEYAYGSTDSGVDSFTNSEFRPVIGTNLRASERPVTDLGLPDGFADSMDTDRDGIGDFAEAKLGWLISRNGQLVRVFSDPGQVDSDGDLLWDVQEQDLRGFCQTDDWRQDALCATRSVAKTDATGIIAGKNGKLDITTLVGDDQYALFPSTDIRNRGLLFGTAVILPGNNGVIETDLAGDDEYTNSQQTLPATDPLLADTDDDGISDGSELFGFAAAMSIVENGTVVVDGVEQGTANTRAQGDDVQRVYPGSPTRMGTVIVTAGENGVLESVPEGDDAYTGFWFIAPGADRTVNCSISGSIDEQMFAKGTNKLDPYQPVIWNPNGGAPTLINSSCLVNLSGDKAGKDVKLYGRIVKTDPLRRDSEGDRISDGFEVVVGSDPTVVDGGDFRDSDYDGLSDVEELLQGWIVKVNGSSVGRLVRSNPSKPDSDFDGLPDFVERDIGTDPNKKDTDGDGLDDYAEFRSVTRVVNFDANNDGVIDGKDTMVYTVDDYSHFSNVFSGFSLTANTSAHNTDPTKSDTDGDGISDYAEVITGYRILATGQNYFGSVILTDPNNPDSDGDGLYDIEEKNGIRINHAVFSTSGTIVKLGETGKVTDAGNPDTDGDGRSDALELADGSITNPLVPDASVNVAYDSIYAINLNDCSQFQQFNVTLPADGSAGITCPEKTNLLWWFYVTGPDGKRSLLSSSDEFAYIPEGSITPIAAAPTRRLLTDVGGTPSNWYAGGMRMRAQVCKDPQKEQECTDFKDISPTTAGYSPNADIDWVYGGPGLTSVWDRFIVEWTGDVYVPVAGDYYFEARSDDGVLLYIDGDNNQVFDRMDGVSGQPTYEQLWGLASGSKRFTQNLVTLTAGWHTIKLRYYDNEGNALVHLKWKVPGSSDIVPIPVGTTTGGAAGALRYEKQGSSFACVGVERDTGKSSFISLARYRDQYSNKAVSSTAPGLPYYGTVAGSEIGKFCKAVDATGKRFYVDGIAGEQTDDLAKVAFDLASSRGIIQNLVRPVDDTDTVSNIAQLETDASGKRYFTLADAGQAMFAQHCSTNASTRLGNANFLLHERESITVEGVVMKVDEITDLTNCPVGSADSAVQFRAGCTKRFSRTFDYGEIVSQGNIALGLQDLAATTSSTLGNGATGCDVDVKTVIGND